jgi:AcrR family transcriptional regulator
MSRVRESEPLKGESVSTAVGGRQGTEAGQPTRDRIVAAAEQLFAARGVDSVSLVEIGVAAGQKNRSAVQYHFGDKAGMVAAIRAKHQPAIEDQRVRLLEELEQKPGAPLRGFVEALVYPLADHVRVADGGRDYLCMSADLLGHQKFSPMSRQSTSSPTAARLLGHIVELSQALPQHAVGPRMLLVTGMLFHGLADHARGSSSAASGQAEDWERIVENLTTCIVAVLEAPAPRRSERRLSPPLDLPSLPGDRSGDRS